MKNNISRFSNSSRRIAAPRPARTSPRSVARDLRPVAAFRHRGWQPGLKVEDYTAPERWHVPAGIAKTRYVVEPAGKDFIHAVSVAEIRERLKLLPERFTRHVEVVQLSPMTRKRRLFPCYGMQWGSAVYLYPIEDSFVEV